MKSTREGNRAAGRDRLADVARGGSLNLVSALIGAVATIAGTVLVTREFSKPVAGAFFAAISGFVLVRAFGSLGANTGLTYFIARLRSLGEEARIPAMMQIAIIPVLVASAAATALMLLLAGPFAHVLLSGHSHESGVTTAGVADALRALALALPFAGLLNTYLGATRGYRDMRPTAFLNQMGLPAAQFLGVLAASLAGSAALLAPLWAVPFVPAALISWLWLRRIRRERAPLRPALPAALPAELAALMELATLVPPSDSRQAKKMPGQHRVPSADSRGFWRFTTPRAIANLAQNILQRIDIVLVAVLLGPAGAAVYTAATRFLIIGQFGSTAIGMAAQPRFAESFAVRDRRGINLVYQVTTAWLIVLTWPLYLLAVAYGPQVLLIFGHSYREGASVVITLGLAMLISTSCGQVDVVLISSGRSTWSLVNGLLAMSVDVGLCLALIPRYGIEGAAIAWAVAIAVSNLMPLAQLAVVERLHPFARGTFIAGALSAACFFVIPLALRALLGRGAAASLAAVALGCLGLAAGLWHFRDTLWLSAMPGVSAARARGMSLMRTLRARAGHR